MCNKFISAERHFPEGSVKLSKTLIIIALFCFAECTAGSCLKYGHSCWGAHGKRNDANVNHFSENDPPTNELPNDMKWFLQKLLQANDYGSRKGRDALPRKIKLLFKEILNDDEIKSNEEGDSLEDQQQDDISAIDKMFPETSEKPTTRNKDAERSLITFLVRSIPNYALLYNRILVMN